MSEPKKRATKKPEAGVPNAEVKPETESQNSKVKSQKNEKEHSAPDTLHSEINKSEIEPMEVHHHPEVEKKGFKEYLLEGLMIFVAVTMGFFAESIRENITNTEHVKQLGMQLVRDLQSDTTSLQECMVYESRKSKQNDSLYQLLKKPLDKMDKLDKEQLQYLVSQAFNLKIFYPSLGAMNAINADLHLKQFSNSKIATYIANYEGSVNVLKEIERIQLNSLDKNIRAFYDDHFTPENMYSIYHNKGVLNSDMRNLSQEDLTRLSVQIVNIQVFNDQLIKYYNKLRSSAEETMQYVTKQYNLGNE